MRWRLRRASRGSRSRGCGCRRGLRSSRAQPAQAGRRRRRPLCRRGRGRCDDRARRRTARGAALARAGGYATRAAALDARPPHVAHALLQYRPVRERRGGRGAGGRRRAPHLSPAPVARDHRLRLRRRSRARRERAATRAARALRQRRAAVARHRRDRGPRSAAPRLRATTRPASRPASMPAPRPRPPRCDSPSRPGRAPASARSRSPVTRSTRRRRSCASSISPPDPISTGPRSSGGSKPMRARLRKLGYYEASVVARRAPRAGAPVVDITVDVEPGPLVSLRFEGDPIPEARRAELVPVQREATVDEDLLEDSKRRIESWLNGQGHWRARADYRRDASEGTARHRLPGERRRDLSPRRPRARGRHGAHRTPKSRH